MIVRPTYEWCAYSPAGPAPKSAVQRSADCGFSCVLLLLHASIHLPVIRFAQQFGKALSNMAVSAHLPSRTLYQSLRPAP